MTHSEFLEFAKLHIRPHMSHHHAHLAVPPVDHQGAGIGRDGVPAGIRGEELLVEISGR
ncbi:hypothetical protein ACIRD8_08845 [Streptomyces sp. NPDC102451]|uniref:hypothetical protein n=1 Tax=Streptomyces sp. NPDC102451 TaxID=3366177 RepID=UPI00381D440A